MTRTDLTDYAIGGAFGIAGFAAGLSKLTTILVMVAASVAWYAARNFWKKPHA